MLYTQHVMMFACMGFVFGVVVATLFCKGRSIERRNPVAVVSVSDGSAQKILEFELHQAQERLIHADKLSALGKLTAGIAHEINNPLSVILGFTQNLIRFSKAAESQLSSLRSIEREALRCRNLVQSLLSFSRSRKSGMALEDPKVMLNNALLLVETQAQMRKVEIVRQFATELPKVFMDGTQIQQVLINLCFNALDAMPNGGVLTVSIDANDQQLEIRVMDTGTGIPVDVREKIFDPFFTTKDPGRGTGLGLSLVQDMIQKHHGHILVETQEGHGTTFQILLPLQSAAESLQNSAA